MKLYYNLYYQDFSYKHSDGKESIAVFELDVICNIKYSSSRFEIRMYSPYLVKALYERK